MINVYFSRPGTVSEVIDRMKTDIKYAKERVLISQYFLTEKDVNKLLQDCRVQKRIILDRKKEGNISTHNCVYLGNPDENSFMHHKFLIIDDVLWIGSMNSSKNARLNNWENMMRVTDKEIVDEYLKEFKRMYIFGKAKVQLSPSACIGKNCMKKVDNPFHHYQVNVIHEVVTIEKNKQFWEADLRQYVQVPLEEPKQETHPRYHLTCKTTEPNSYYHDDERCEICKKHILAGTLNKIQYKRSHHEYLTEVEGRLSQTPKTPVTKEEIDEELFVCLDCLYDELDRRDWL